MVEIWKRGNTYSGGMSIQAVFDQFLNHGDKAVANNLAGLDLVDLGIRAGSVLAMVYAGGRGGDVKTYRFPLDRLDGGSHGGLQLGD